jgi:hypothetical protein
MVHNSWTTEAAGVLRHINEAKKILRFAKDRSDGICHTFHATPSMKVKVLMPTGKNCTRC